jgi:hypothetical protein
MRHSRWLMLVLVVAAGACLAASACGSDQALTAPLDSAKDIAAKAAVRAIDIGVQAQYAMNGAYPVTISSAEMQQFVSPWPENPFTQAPMAQGTSPGDVVYTSTAGSYHLAVYLSDGSQYVLK